MVNYSLARCMWLDYIPVCLISTYLLCCLIVNYSFNLQIRETPFCPSVQRSIISEHLGPRYVSRVLYRRLLCIIMNVLSSCDYHVTLQVRTCQRLTWVEWLFIVLATVTMAAIAGMSVERFIFIHNNFANITPDGNISAGGGNGSGDNQMTNCLRWSCLNDFTFAILGLVNWCKFSQLEHTKISVPLVTVRRFGYFQSS